MSFSCRIFREDSRWVFQCFWGFCTLARGLSRIRDLLLHRPRRYGCWWSGSFWVFLPKIYLSNDQIIEINKNIPITEKDFIYVYIHGLTINGIDESILNDFIYTSNGGDRLISLESRFKISNYEDGVINYISSRNFDNNRTKTLQSISWLYPINHEFHKVKIYADGIPDNLFNITFYGQNIEQSKPEEIMASTTVSLNDYRNIKPNNIDLNASHISYRLHVYWQ